MTWLALSSSDKNLDYWKELLPVGDYRRKTEKSDMEFSIDEPFLEHLSTTFESYLSNGNKVPIYRTHEETPENRMGTVTGVEVREGSRGKKALFVKTSFATEADRDMALKNDVSAFIPQRLFDGSGVEYKRPLKHVAVTSTPVIPGLSEFETIAASFVDDNQPEVSMLNELLKALGISVEDDADDKAKFNAIVAKFKSAEKKPEEEADKKKDPIAASFDPPAGVVKAVKNARTVQLDTLLRERKITPAHRDDLVKQFCEDNSITLSLSMDEDHVDPFESVVAALSKVEAQTGKKEIKLDHSEEDGVSPLVASARKMAEAAKK